MTLSATIALLVALIVLAVIPGPGVLVVASRSLTNGFKAGVTVTLGLLTGDFIYITLSIAGLASLANTYYEVFTLIRYLGATYLIYLALCMYFKKNINTPDTNKPAHQSANFISGLLTCLSNPKAILFYISFFPSFIDLQNLNALALIEIYLAAFCGIGSVMLAYAYTASCGGNLLMRNGFAARIFRYFAGTALAGSAIVVLSRT